jgi:hypothetical protein
MQMMQPNVYIERTKYPIDRSNSLSLSLSLSLIMHDRNKGFPPFFGNFYTKLYRAIFLYQEFQLTAILERLKKKKKKKKMFNLFHGCI